MRFNAPIYSSITPSRCFAYPRVLLTTPHFFPLLESSEIKEESSCSSKEL